MKYCKYDFENISKKLARILTNFLNILLKMFIFIKKILKLKKFK